MGKKKDKDKGPKPSLFRIIIFLSLAGGLIWYLSSQISADTESLTDHDNGQIKGQTDIQEQIDRVLPVVVKKQVEEINQRFYSQGDEVVKDTERVIRETKLAEEIEKIILQTTKEMEGFPEKQKQDLKKEAIQQVCESLMEKVENEQNNE